ncbi:Crp/Fnr family transcriptional regulator [Paenibacillus sp. 1001270B_150601_E10]|uniref:Crp/Fnr family transcriptional regulator n=1 Tax=Paenibacillus sp. 1001270B_150601_E10 TaxID=2787079 RepID=UPI0018A08911|nr:Crp/Fnr family transcriptional regulator [Paenibacillus sp. 1001270B_150601_E10]
MSENKVCVHHRHEECISLVPIFNHLEAEQMKEISQAFRREAYKKGEIIYHAGDQSDSLYIVNSGRIRIYRLSESGKQQLVRILQARDFTGELALFRDSFHDCYAEAVIDTQVCRIQRADLQDFLLAYPSISLKFLLEFANRLEQSEQQTTRFATVRVDTRIAVYLAECLEGSSAPEFDLPMSKKDVASYLGTTPETISRNLTHLEERGLIRRKSHRRIEVLDVDGLLRV